MSAGTTPHADAALAIKDGGVTAAVANAISMCAIAPEIVLGPNCGKRKIAQNASSAPPTGMTTNKKASLLIVIVPGGTKNPPFPVRPFASRSPSRKPCRVSSA